MRPAFICSWLAVTGFSRPTGSLREPQVPDGVQGHGSDPGVAGSVRRTVPVGVEPDNPTAAVVDDPRISFTRDLEEVGGDLGWKEATAGAVAWIDRHDPTLEVGDHQEATVHNPLAERQPTTEGRGSDLSGVRVDPQDGRPSPPPRLRYGDGPELLARGEEEAGIVGDWFRQLLVDDDLIALSVDGQEAAVDVGEPQPPSIPGSAGQAHRGDVGAMHRDAAGHGPPS
ncbi:MAG: hypothetical protein ACRDGP_09515 [Actinomycetota bacterium]